MRGPCAGIHGRAVRTARKVSSYMAVSRRYHVVMDNGLYSRPLDIWLIASSWNEGLMRVVDGHATLQLQVSSPLRRCLHLRAAGAMGGHRGKS